MSLPAEIALFPLNTVLFPGMLLPLHIFEPRYRRMIHDCQEEQKPFGLVLAGGSVSDVAGTNWGRPTEAAPHTVGTTAHLQHIERLPDGRFNIAVVGRDRFRIVGFRFDQPYLVGQIEPFPLDSGDPPAVAARSRQVHDLFGGYVAALEAVVGQSLNVQEDVTDAESLAHLVAIVLQVNLEIKQRLLAAPTLAEMLAMERQLLETETAILRYMQQTRPTAGASGPTPN